MCRKWALLPTVAAIVVVCLAAVSSLAQDTKTKAPLTPAEIAKKSPLQKVMIKMEDETTAIRKVTTSAARFKKSGMEKKLPAVADDLVKYGKETRKFTEPAETVKKPLKKWEEYADQYIAASEELGKSAKKKNFIEIQRSWKALDNTCTNCHGLFRPKTGGDDFGTP